MTAVEALGFQASVEVSTLAGLRSLLARGVPAILPVHTSQLPTYPLPPWERHTVVVVGATNREVTFQDPGAGREMDVDVVPAQQFDAAWGARGHRMAVLELR